MQSSQASAALLPPDTTPCGYLSLRCNSVTQGAAAKSFCLTTFLLLCLVSVVEGADEILVPAVFYQISNEFGAGPALLGTITLCRGITQSVVALFSGPLGNRFNRIHIIGVGCIFWGFATIVVGSSTSISTLLVARAVNGMYTYTHTHTHTHTITYTNTH
jgi:predicted MFS family arabinose efflux permease